MVFSHQFPAFSLFPSFPAIFPPFSPPPPAGCILLDCEGLTFVEIVDDIMSGLVSSCCLPTESAQQVRTLLLTKHKHTNDTSLWEKLIHSATGTQTETQSALCCICLLFCVHCLFVCCLSAFVYCFVFVCCLSAVVYCFVSVICLFIVYCIFACCFLGGPLRKTSTTDVLSSGVVSENGSGSGHSHDHAPQLEPRRSTFSHLPLLIEESAEEVRRRKRRRRRREGGREEEGGGRNGGREGGRERRRRRRMRARGRVMTNSLFIPGSSCHFSHHRHANRALCNPDPSSLGSPSPEEGLV